MVIYNTEAQNKEIASKILQTPFIISLTNNYTHYDVAFAIVKASNISSGLFQRGVATQSTSLLVAINGKSSFVFSLDNNERLIYSTYVAEKLNISDGDLEIAEQITDLINQIITDIHKSATKYN